MDHIYIACLRLYFLYYLDSYCYAPELRCVSSAITETADTADVADAVPDFKQESAHAFVDLEERESADTAADFEEELADAVSVDFER